MIDHAAHHHPQDFILEIQTEELPPLSLFNLADAFCLQIKERLQKAGLAFDAIHFFATPRRLAIYVKQLAPAQADQWIERKGPLRSAAFDAKGNPSAACIGFARSCGVNPEALILIQHPQGEWVGFRQHVPGQSIQVLLPALIEEALAALPIPKRMRWNAGNIEFIRPVHSVLMLYGDQIIDCTILGLKTGRLTHGHRFYAPHPLSLPHASHYAAYLEEKGYVIADFAERRARLLSLAEKILLAQVKEEAIFVADDALINEVTGLVEWPIALLGKFDSVFLTLPEEVLISAMQDHQRYFPIRHKQTRQLMPYFITIANIESRDPQRVIHGNERVLRARLSDAAFFYQADQKETLAERVSHLKGIRFQEKLGTLYDKTIRISHLAEWIAQKWHLDSAQAKRAGWLAKADLTTLMVKEFPELQGIMGYYYALHEKESNDIALALKEYYLPRFAGDALPMHGISQALALADRIDTLTGIFGINQRPTGDKDPFGLRRAALGIVRILLEHGRPLDLEAILNVAIRCYDPPLPHATVSAEIINFILERMRTFLLDQGIAPDVYASVAALSLTDPIDIYHRIQAVQTFKQLEAAASLSTANKRVSNIIHKYADTMEATTIDSTLFEHEAETILARQLKQKQTLIGQLATENNYNEMLLQLAELHQAITHFFDQVMVMTDDKSRRENRILLLTQLRHLFLTVADIALLQ